MTVEMAAHIEIGEVGEDVHGPITDRENGLVGIPTIIPETALQLPMPLNV